MHCIGWRTMTLLLIKKNDCITTSIIVIFYSTYYVTTLQIKNTISIEFTLIFQCLNIRRDSSYYKKNKKRACGVTRTAAVAVALPVLTRHHWAMDQLRPLPAFHHSIMRTSVFSDPKDCSHVFQRGKGIRASSKRPYRDTYKVMDCKEKSFETKVRGQLITVAIDRINPLASWQTNNTRVRVHLPVHCQINRYPQNLPKDLAVV